MSYPSSRIHSRNRKVPVVLKVYDMLTWACGKMFPQVEWHSVPKRIRRLDPSVAFLTFSLTHLPLLLLLLTTVPLPAAGAHRRRGRGVAVAVAALALPLCGAHQRRRGRGWRGHCSPICPTLGCQSPTVPQSLLSHSVSPPFFLMSDHCGFCAVLSSWPTAATTSFLPNENRRTTPTSSAAEPPLRHLGHFKSILSGIRIISRFFSCCVPMFSLGTDLRPERVHGERPAFHIFMQIE